jgi:hypothetical protein
MHASKASSNASFIIESMMGHQRVFVMADTPHETRKALHDSRINDASLEEKFFMCKSMHRVELENLMRDLLITSLPSLISEHITNENLLVLNEDVESTASTASMASTASTASTASNKSDLKEMLKKLKTWADIEDEDEVLSTSPTPVSDINSDIDTYAGRVNTSRINNINSDFPLLGFTQVPTRRIAPIHQEYVVENTPAVDLPPAVNHRTDLVGTKTGLYQQFPELGGYANKWFAPPDKNGNPVGWSFDKNTNGKPSRWLKAFYKNNFRHCRNGQGVWCHQILVGNKWKAATIEELKDFIKAEKISKIQLE